MRRFYLFLSLALMGSISISATPSVADENGKLPCQFSVSATKKVYFSQGNLQYQASSHTWRFAENQWDYVGDASNGNVYLGETKCNNANISSTYTGWIDLFGWGTGNNPTNVSKKDADFTWHEWGGNIISNGGNKANFGWRTLTSTEWTYLISSRTNSAQLRRIATVHGVLGLILLPDGWTLSASAISSLTTPMSNEDWTKLENEGAVFLPAAGDRWGTFMYNVGTNGKYWTPNSYGSGKAYYLYFTTGSPTVNSNNSSNALSVRLVSEIAPLPAAVITSVPTAKTGLTYILSTPQTLINAGEAEGGAMLYSLDGTNWSEELPQGTNATTYTVYYKVQGDGVTHKDYTPSPNTFNVTISPADIVLPSFSTDLIYNGAPQPLLDITGIVGGTIYYSVDGNEPWLDVCPSETEIGTYDIWYKVDAANANYNSIPATKVTVTIDDPYPFVADNADPLATLTSLLNTPSDLKVKRTIYADDEYNTICLPFALNESALAASPLAGFNRLKTFKGAQVTGTAPDLYIDIFVEDATTIEAGVPYLITYPSAHADIVDPVFHGITVTTTEPSAVSVDGITFQGMFAQVHIDPYTSSARDEDYLFVGANSQLYWPLSTQTSSDIKMRGFRAYFIIDRNSISPALAPKGTRARIMDAPKTTTAIDNPSAKFGGSEKIIENGILYIIRNGVKYNAQGQIVK